MKWYIFQFKFKNTWYYKRKKINLKLLTKNKWNLGNCLISLILLSWDFRLLYTFLISKFHNISKENTSKTVISEKSLKINVIVKHALFIASLFCGVKVVLCAQELRKQGPYFKFEYTLLRIFPPD